MWVTGSSEVDVWPLMVTAALAADVAGSSDHPVVSRFQGAEIIGYRQDAFARYVIPLSTVDWNAGPEQSEAVEGRVTRIMYAVPKGTSAIEVGRSYALALDAAGFDAVWSCESAACGPGFRRLDTFQPELVVNAIRGRVRDQQFLTVRSAREGGEVRVSVFAAVHESPLPWLMERVVVEVDVVEVGSLVAGKVDADADAMLQQLSETGRVALYGMYFDTGKAVLTPASEPTLTDVVALLNGNPGLSLYVVGHTDMVGSLSSNLDLSQRRAAAVVDALVAAGIARGRLEAYGAGPVAPVAENVTEAGRARNRRVELVVR